MNDCMCIFLKSHSQVLVFCFPFIIPFVRFRHFFFSNQFFLLIEETNSEPGVFFNPNVTDAEFLHMYRTCFVTINKTQKKGSFF